MRSAGAEPIAWKASESHVGYRLHRAADRSAVMSKIACNTEKVGQAACRAQLPSKVRSYFQVAQRMRARRLASATVALL